MYFRLSNTDVRPFMEAYERKTLGSRLGGEKHLFFSLTEKVVGVVGEGRVDQDSSLFQGYIFHRYKHKFQIKLGPNIIMLLLIVQYSYYVKLCLDHILSQIHVYTCVTKSSVCMIKIHAQYAQIIERSVDSIFKTPSR